MSDGLLGNPVSAGIRETLIEELKSKVCTIEFTKVDGTRRQIRGTLKSDLVPESDLVTDGREKSQEVLPFYDVEAEHWKSARIDRLIAFDAGENFYMWVTSEEYNPTYTSKVEDLLAQSMIAGKHKTCTVLVHPDTTDK